VKRTTNSSSPAQSSLYWSSLLIDLANTSSAIEELVAAIACATWPDPAQLKLTRLDTTKPEISRNS
jgi:hypothetical protein